MYLIVIATWRALPKEKPRSTSRGFSNFSIALELLRAKARGVCEWTKRWIAGENKMAGVKVGFLFNDNSFFNCFISESQWDRMQSGKYISKLFLIVSVQNNAVLCLLLSKSTW